MSSLTVTIYGNVTNIPNEANKILPEIEIYLYI